MVFHMGGYQYSEIPDDAILDLPHALSAYVFDMIEYPAKLAAKFMDVPKTDFGGLDDFNVDSPDPPEEGKEGVAPVTEDDILKQI